MSSVWSRIISKPHHPSLFEHGYKIVKAIGYGANGRVYDVERLNDGKTYAAKMVGGNVRMSAGADMPLEADILLHLTDVPDVPRLHDVFTTRYGTHVMVMDKPLEPFETLANAMAKRSVDARRIMSNLVQILRDVDAFDVCHMDIHSHNILVSSGWRVTLVDFGRAMYKKSSEENTDERTVESMCSMVRSVDPDAERLDPRMTLQQLFVHPYFAPPMEVDHF
jgi:serine/threonine protein kinase